ncbi:hypothetical protein JCM10908_006725 [Rhodotorula pacifica]|uniref:rRNA-processing protein SAS10 n=1 Tax=Rhodotorula pacifica TaxID=1495444 RepID=UPI003174C893
MGKPKNVGARKATQYRAKQIAPEAAFDRSKSRFNSNSIQSYEDTYGSGDEDQFHLNRDKLLLDEVVAGGRTGGEQDEVEEVDTIYDLDLPSSASDDEDDDDEEAEDKPARVPRHLREYKRKDTGDNKTLGRFGHEYDPKQDVVFPSSEEDSDDDDVKGGSVDASQLAGQDGDSDSDSAPSRNKKRGSDDENEANSDSDLDQEHERWSAGHYHASRRAPGEADSEDDEALELEEQEARRLQKKMKDRLDGADFGVAGEEGEEEDEMDVEKAKQERLRLEEEDETAAADTGKTSTTPTADLSEEEAIALLLRTQPETLALVDDFLLTSSKLAQVTHDLAEVRAAKNSQGNDHPSLAIMELEHQALTTYLPTLAFYFSLLLGNKAPEQGLVDKVLARLSSLRGALATMEELDLTSATYGAAQSDDDEDDEDASEEEGADLKSSKSRRLVPPEEMFNLADSDASTQASDDSEVDEITGSMLVGIDDDELEELMQELGPGDGAEVLMEKVRERQREKGIEVQEEDGESDDEEEDDVMEEDVEEEEEAPAAPVQTKTRRTPAIAAIPALPALAPMSTKPSSASASTRSTTAASDLLDPLSLSRTDLADKASKRHTLRFHAAQVEQKASRRDARRRGLEGDDDVPRRSKEQARREVLKRQQHGAAKDAKERARLDGDEFGEEDERDARAVRGEGAGAAADEADEDGYYDLVAAEKAEGRQAKKARYDEARAAERYVSPLLSLRTGSVFHEWALADSSILSSREPTNNREEILSLAESAVDGPRAATRKILSNRGLTPKRNKLNRNARVKKRHQYDQKQKKLRSMQATYSGGEARTGYEGERTGISRQNVRSRKLG